MNEKTWDLNSKLTFIWIKSLSEELISVLKEAFLEILVFALFISILFFGIVEISTGGLLDWVLLLFILELRLLSPIISLSSSFFFFFLILQQELLWKQQLI